MMIIRLIGWLTRHVVSRPFWRDLHVSCRVHRSPIVVARARCFLMRLWRRDWKRRWVHFGLFWRF